MGWATPARLLAPAHLVESCDAGGPFLKCAFGATAEQAVLEGSRNVMSDPSPSTGADVDSTAIRFVPVKSAFNSPQDAVGKAAWTFLLPAVTVGNIGQLAVDLLLSSTCSQHVGRLAAPATLPFAAPAPSAPQHLSSIVTTIELYTVPSESGKVIVAQQRAPLSPGRAAEHARALVNWARSSGCAEIVLLGSANAAGRRDQQIRSGESPSARIRFAATQAMMSNKLGERVRERGWKPVDGEFSGLGWIAGDDGLSVADENRVDGSVSTPSFLPTARKGSFTREVLQHCTDVNFPVAAILLFAFEGDNSSDARVMASAVSVLLNVDVIGSSVELSVRELPMDALNVAGRASGHDANTEVIENDPLSAYMGKWSEPPVWKHSVEPPPGLY